MNINHRDEFLKELDKKIQWEWRWERLNRISYVTVNWILWSTRFLLLALAIYQVKIIKDITSQSLIIFIIAFLSALNIVLPLLLTKFRFQQRQEVYDRNARKYEVIKNELLTGKITLDIAVDKFNKIYQQPTETIIRQTS